MKSVKYINYSPPRGAMAEAFPLRAHQLLKPSDPPAVAWAKMGDDEGLARFMQRSREAKNLKQAIEEGDEQDWRALMWSCRGFPYGEEEGGDGEAHSSESIMQGRDRCARLLIDAGADVEAETPDTAFRCITWATRDGRQKVLGLLLQAGANPHARSRYGIMPINVAYQEGHVECLTEFILAGAFNEMNPTLIWEMLKGQRNLKQSETEQAHLAAWLLGQLGLGPQSWAWERLVEFRATQPAWAGLVMSTLEAMELANLVPVHKVEPSTVRRI